MKNKKIFVVLQGNMDYFSEIKQHYDGFKNIIFSTWNNRKDIVENEEYYVTSSNPFFSGIQNINYQIKSTIAGIKYAKKLGATHVFKCRDDIVFSDIQKLVEILSSDDKFYFPIYHNHEDGYFVDYFQFGDVQDMYNLWNMRMKINFINKKYPEYYVTRSCYKNIDLHKISYIKSICEQNGIQCKWLKRDIDIINEFNTKPAYEERRWK